MVSAAAAARGYSNSINSSTLCPVDFPTVASSWQAIFEIIYAQVYADRSSMVEAIIVLVFLSSASLTVRP